MNFRLYHPQDRAGCLAVFRGNTPPFFDPSEKALYQAFLDADPQPYFVLETAGRIVACGGLALFPNPAAGVTSGAGLSWGMVARERHGQGLGSELLRLRLAWLREHDPAVTELRLVTSQHTQAFYARQGFEVVSVRPNGFGAGLDEIQMGLKLQPPQAAR